MRWGGRWKGGSGWGTYVNPWLSHVNVWQKPLQYCKVISLQLIKINEKKKKRKCCRASSYYGPLELDSASDPWGSECSMCVRGEGAEVVIYTPAPISWQKAAKHKDHYWPEACTRKAYRKGYLDAGSQKSDQQALHEKGEGV